VPGRRGRFAARFNALALATLAAATPAAGHDFWLEPSRFEPAPGELVTVGLRVGEPWSGESTGEAGPAGEAVARDPGHIERFALVGPAGEEPVAGGEGADPAGLVRPPSPGRYTLVFRSLPTPITLDAARFEAYLAEEGLDGVLAARAARGAGGESGRERFSRCAKALLRVGDSAQVPDLPVGLRLELIAETDPYALAGGGELALALVFEGAPLSGSLVEAYGPGGRRRAARSGADGRVRFDLDAAGPWLVTAVHMVPAPAASGADWESVWASLAFALPEG
jgi:uncharacterized GH25 family protein